MVKQIIPAVIVIAFLSSCSTFKPLNFTSNKQVASVSPAATESKFIEDIAVTPPATSVKQEVKPQPQVAVKKNIVSDKASTAKNLNSTPKVEAPVIDKNVPEIEYASEVQLKYAILLNTEVEALPNKTLLEAVDEWYGVRYRSGGNTKSGVDCSGFTVAVYAAAYGLTIPRVSREQYRTSRKISTTELEEGDLVFFNTNGRGVSHVGVYLGNNKFIHASVSRGVMVSDLFESYYLKRFVGAGRVDDKEIVVRN